MKAIIFGVSVQDGHYLSALLKEQGYEVIGICSRQYGLGHVDIANYSSVDALVKQHSQDYIFHLAANSTTRHEALFENHSTIETGTLNIREAVKNNLPLTKVFISGSGVQFKSEGKPVKETDAFEARDAYSVSRIQFVYAARYFRTIGVKAYVGYFFNHDSPQRTERHMTPKIAEAVKRIGGGSNEQLAIGDIDAIKEYTYAGDWVKGILTLVNQDKITEANISSRKGYSIKDWLDQCFSIINKDWQNHVVVNADFVSPYQQLVSDASRRHSLGWRPEIDFEELAKQMMK
jgi:GDPmannose 4,6-dehydratase